MEQRPTVPDSSASIGSSAPAQAAGILARLLRDGYDVVGGDAMRRILEMAGGTDWAGYAGSWDDLGPDRFMADGGTYRKRRFACFSATSGGLARKPSQPHFQTRMNNPLNGGMARVFDPVLDGVAFHPINRAVMAACLHLFGEATPPARRPTAWHAEMHQFRIEAQAGTPGQPTPEGLHRDGVDWVLVVMVRRENVDGGVSTVADVDGRPLASATLSDPLDAVLVNDHRMFHGVSPIRAVDPARPAFRDVLVVTFRAEPVAEGEA